MDDLLEAGLTRVKGEVNPNQQVKEVYYAMMALPYPEFEKKYKMRDHRNKDFLINRFSQIGWPEPFPEDPPEPEIKRTSTLSVDGDGNQPEESWGVRVPEGPDDLAYPEERFVHGISPSVIYIPSRQVMLKMMRACIGITDPKDLWLFNTADE